MKRSRLSRLTLVLRLTALLAGFCSPALAAPPPATEALWQTLVGWLEVLWVDAAAGSNQELNEVPWLDPHGRARAGGNQELNEAPSADPHGRARATGGDQELNEVPTLDPYG